MRIAIDWPAAGKALAFFTAISAFMAFINPYEAARFESFLLKFGYWFSLIIVGAVTGRVGIYLAEKFQDPPHWITHILLASTTASFGVTWAIFGFESIRRRAFDIPPNEFPQIFGLVFVISLAITGVSYLSERAQEAAPATANISDPVSTFMERLPVKYRTAKLFAISSEDHYLRVHTSLGEELILMRLTDAMRELATADGLQTHRSWWVAKSGVTDAKRENGKLVLVLKSGIDVPVSRTYVRAVKDAGLSS